VGPYWVEGPSGRSALGNEVLRCGLSAASRVESGNFVCPPRGGVSPPSFPGSGGRGQVLAALRGWSGRDALGLFLLRNIPRAGGPPGLGCRRFVFPLRLSSLRIRRGYVLAALRGWSAGEALALCSCRYDPPGLVGWVVRWPCFSCVTIPRAGGRGHVLAALRGWSGGEALDLFLLRYDPRAGGRGYVMTALRGWSGRDALGLFLLRYDSPGWRPAGAGVPQVRLPASPFLTSYRSGLRSGGPPGLVARQEVSIVFVTIAIPRAGGRGYVLAALRGWSGGEVFGFYILR